MKISAYGIKEKGGKPELFLYEKNVDNNEVLVRITHRCIATSGDRVGVGY
jgi:uncharacterized zinc-type alcohol dehydrogenase-like protein